MQAGTTQERPPIALEIERGDAAADPPVVLVDDLGGEPGERFERVAPSDVFLADSS